MKIITYHSHNSPPEKSWVAYWQVDMKPKNPVEASKEGIMPYSFWGATEIEAIAKAQDGWNTSFGKGEKARKDREALLSTVRTRTRA